MLNRSHAKLLFALLSLLSQSCDINPHPQPPPASPITLERLSAESNPSGYVPVVVVRGAPGAVSIQNAIVWVANLDNTYAPASLSVSADGSFEGSVNGNAGDELRLQVRTPTAHSVPLDVQVPQSEPDHPQPFVLAPRPLAECLTTHPALTLQAPQATVTNVRLQNECAEPVAVESVALRLNDAAIRLKAPTVPFLLPSGAATEIELELMVAVPPLAEDILLIEISAPKPDRRPVTISVVPAA